MSPPRRALLALSLAASACSRPPTAPTPASIPSDGPTPSDAAVVPPWPARWIDSSGATAIGPAIAGGTLVLLGGRRALVAPDGAVRPETAPAPEPLIELIAVATAAGARRLLGRGVLGVYRFDDPLGAAVTLFRGDAELVRIGAGPGLVAIWDITSDLPRFIDVDTALPRSLASLPALPLRAVAFSDLEHGAGVFEAVGLAVTSNGGASWRQAAGEDRHDSLNVAGVRLRGDEVRAFVHAGGGDALVDIAGARLGPMADGAAPAGEPPLLRWVRATSLDPLEAAVVSGAAAGPGIAVTASNGLIGRVELSRGLLLELSAIADDARVGACGVGVAGRGAWVACPLNEQDAGSFYDPFGVFRVSLGPGRLSVGAPAVARSGGVELRTSPSGGAMLMGPCSADDAGAACVRQPSGMWISMRTDIALAAHGAGPLADGRVAIVRGLWERDVARRGEERAGDGNERGAAPELHLAVVDTAGQEKPLPPLGWPGEPGGEVRVVSPIEEGTYGQLSFIVANDRGELTAIVQPITGNVAGAASLQPLAGAACAKIHAGHGVAVGEGVLLASRDAGLSWASISAPPQVTASASLASVLEDPHLLAVNEVGLKVDTHLRVGWGDAADPASAAPPAPASGASLAPASGAPPAPASAASLSLGPERVLSCTTQGLAGVPGVALGLPPLLVQQEVVALLEKGAPAPSRAIERGVSSAVGGRMGMLDVAAILEEQRPADMARARSAAGTARDAAVAGSSTAAPRIPWTLRWFDPTAPQANLRSWTGPAPAGVPWGATLRSVAALGARALFTIRAGDRTLLLRTKPNGGADVVDVPPELSPGSDVVFGDGGAEAIAWLREDVLIAWSGAAPPQPIAAFVTRSARGLGQPTTNGVPLLLSAGDWALLRTIPIPPNVPSLLASSASPAAAPPLSLDGWTNVPNVRRALTHLPACGARPRGARFRLHRSLGEAMIDGQPAAVESAVYDVRVSSEGACVASIAALLSYGRPSAQGRPDAAPPAFVRADLAARRAEGGERGLSAQGSVRKLACALIPRP